MKYVVMHANTAVLYGIMDKDKYKCFKNERDMGFFNVFKLEDNEVDEFVKDQALDPYQYETYFLSSDDDGDSGTVVISYEEEMMFQENYGIHLMDYTDSFRRMYKTVISGAIKFNEEEMKTILSYMSKLYVYTIDEESEEYAEREEDGLSTFDDVKLIIDTLLTSYGFLRRAYDED